MADEQVTIDLKIVDNTENSIKGLKELKKLLRSLPADSEAFGVVSNKINDIEDALKGAKKGTADLVDTLAAAPGPLGALGRGLNSLKVATVSFGAALKAAGIGLLVSVIGGIAAAFSQVEGSGKKLEPLLIGLQKILGGLVEGFQPLLDIFLDLALKALPYVVSGIKNVYGGLVAFFTLLKESGVGAGKILKGIFTLDTKSIKEGYAQIGGSLDKAKVTFNEFTANFEKGYAKQTATQKKNLKDQKETLDKAYDEAVKRADAYDKLDDARIEKAKALALSLATTEQEKLDVEVKFAKIKYDADKQNLLDRLALAKKYGQDTTQIQADLEKLDATYITTVATNNDKLKELNKKRYEDRLKLSQSGKDLIDFQITQQAAADKFELDELYNSTAEKLRVQEKYNEDLRQIIQQSNNDRELALKVDTENRKAILDEQFANGLIKEKEYNDAVNALYKDSATQQAALTQSTRDLEIQRLIDINNLAKRTADEEKALFDIRKQSYQSYADSISSIFSSVAAMYEQDSAAQVTLTKISVLVRGAAAIADTILSAKAQLAQYSLAGATAKATIIQGGALSTNPITLPIGAAMIAAGTAAQAAATAGKVATLIGSGLQVAAIGVSTAAQIAAINSAAQSKGASASSGGGAGGGSSDAGGGSTPAFSAPQIGAPQIGASSNQQGQLAGIIAGALDKNNSEGRPIRAYVVGNDITSEQQLQRRIKAAARLGG
jgi:hypothetical protein